MKNSSVLIWPIPLQLRRVPNKVELSSDCSVCCRLVLKLRVLKLLSNISTQIHPETEVKTLNATMKYRSRRMNRDVQHTK